MDEKFKRFQKMAKEEFGLTVVHSDKQETFKDIFGDDITDEEYDAIAEETYDNLVHSLIEAGAEVSQLRQDNKEILELLKLARDSISLMLCTYDGAFEEDMQDVLYKIDNRLFRGKIQKGK